MAQPAAKQGDQVTASDTHLIQPPPPATPVSTPDHTFKGIIDGNLSPDVTIGGKAAATVDSTATNTPPHLPPPGSTFAPPLPSNKGTITSGSASVTVNGKALARNGDRAKTCNHPVDLEIGTVVATGTVLVG